MNRQALRLLPWVISAVLAVAVWRDHSRTLVPWLISLVSTFATGWAFGRRRRYTPRRPRTTQPKSIRAAAQVVPVHVPVTVDVQRTMTIVPAPAPQRAARKPKPLFSEQEKGLIHSIYENIGLDRSELDADLNASEAR